MIRCIQKLRITGAEQLNVDELIQVASNIMSNLKGGFLQTGLRYKIKKGIVKWIKK